MRAIAVLPAVIAIAAAGGIYAAVASHDHPVAVGTAAPLATNRIADPALTAAGSYAVGSPQAAPPSNTGHGAPSPQGSTTTSRSAVSPTPSAQPRTVASPPGGVVAVRSVSATPPTGSRLPPAPVAPVATTHPSPRPPARARARTAVEQAVFDLLNQERAQSGALPLAWSGQLALSAQRHCDAMVNAGALSHQLPGELTLRGRASSAGFPGTTLAENLAQGGDSSESGALNLQDFLFRDAPHRANIVSTQMNYVGISIDVDSSGQLWLTEDFGHP